MKKLLTQQMVDQEKRPRPETRKPKKSRAAGVSAVHPDGCLCGRNHQEDTHD